MVEPMWPLILATALPALIEQLGKTVRAKLKTGQDAEIRALRARIEALEIRAKWS